ncbi:hypothetical protein RUND412_010142, partial [Rhizina undulata]
MNERRRDHIDHNYHNAHQSPWRKINWQCESWGKNYHRSKVPGRPCPKCYQKCIVEEFLEDAKNAAAQEGDYLFVVPLRTDKRITFEDIWYDGSIQMILPAKYDVEFFNKKRDNWVHSSLFVAAAGAPPEFFGKVLRETQIALGKTACVIEVSWEKRMDFLDVIDKVYTPETMKTLWHSIGGKKIMLKGLKEVEVDVESSIPESMSSMKPDYQIRLLEGEGPDAETIFTVDCHKFLLKGRSAYYKTFISSTGFSDSSRNYSTLRTDDFSP